MKCPLCGSKFRVFEWRSNADPLYYNRQLVGFSGGNPEASFRCSGHCSVVISVHGLRDVNKAMEEALPL